MPHLFSELRLRDLTLPNRIGVSPMCQYSCTDGYANDWHFAHLAARAVGGAGLIFTEAAAVTAEGMISPQDLGVWSEKHFEPLERIARFIDAQGAIAGIQLAHAGRKASVYRPWSGRGAVPEAQGGWKPVAPSAVRFADDYATPEALSLEGVAATQRAFALAAERAYAAGFRVIELHAAHGYLFHQFLSPLSNQRTDAYGGSFDNRIRIVCETVAAARKALPDRCPSSCASPRPIGPRAAGRRETVELARRLKDLGVDLIDCLLGRQCRTGGDPRRRGLSGARSPRASGARPESRPPRSA